MFLETNSHAFTARAKEMVDNQRQSISNHHADFTEEATVLFSYYI